MKKIYLKWVIVGMSLFMVFLSNKTSKGSSVEASVTLPPLPEQHHWIDQGIAFYEGSEGEWDRYLWGAFANSLIKKDGKYFLYYQGSNGYDDTCGDNSNRQIGLATSEDGINWTKSANNPVISWSAQGPVTEGALSSAAILELNGNVYIYYGAGSAHTNCLIHSSGRLSQSSDGVSFTDIGEPIPNIAPLWGNGDEIFPVGAYVNQDKWNIFYIPNGVGKTNNRKLGVISGTSAVSLNANMSFGVNNNNLPAWGPVSIVNDGTIAYAFVNDAGTNKPVKAYSFDPNNPSTMTLRKNYVFPDCFQASIILDSDQNRWLMLCREKANSSHYLIKVASTIHAPTPTVIPTPTSSIMGTPTPTRVPKATPVPTLMVTPTPSN
jgi:hypothetical protein